MEIDQGDVGEHLQLDLDQHLHGCVRHSQAGPHTELRGVRWDEENFAPNFIIERLDWAYFASIKKHTILINYESFVNEKLQ